MDTEPTTQTNQLEEKNKPYRNSLKDYQAYAFIENEARWVDGFGYPAGHVNVASHGRSIVGKKCEGPKFKSQLIANSIIIPNHSCVLDFKVSGEFDIGIIEDGKCRADEIPPLKKP